MNWLISRISSNHQRCMFVHERDPVAIFSKTSVIGFTKLSSTCRYDRSQKPSRLEKTVLPLFNANMGVSWCFQK